MGVHTHLQYAVQIGHRGSECGCSGAFGAGDEWAIEPTYLILNLTEVTTTMKLRNLGISLSTI